MKLTELATYVGSPDFLATSLARRVVNSMVGSTVLSGVDSGWLGLYRWKVVSLGVHRHGVGAYIGDGIYKRTQGGWSPCLL